MNQEAQLQYVTITFHINHASLRIYLTFKRYVMKQIYDYP